MALQMSITNEQGVTTDYHKIRSATLRGDKLTCLMDNYVSKDHRLQGHSANSCVFDFTVSLEEEESMGIRALCYSKIKQLDEWQSANDC